MKINTCKQRHRNTSIDLFIKQVGNQWLQQWNVMISNTFVIIFKKRKTIDIFIRLHIILKIKLTIFPNYVILSANKLKDPRNADFFQAWKACG